MGKDHPERFQPKGNTWEERAAKGELAAVLDPGDTKGYKNEYRDLLHKTVLSKYLPSSKDKRILDFGCGSGRFTSWLTKKGFEVVGVDVTKEMIYTAKKAYQDYKFILYDGNNLPFKDESFDCIISVWVLQHITVQNDFQKVAKELIRCLKPGGTICLIEQVSKKESDYYIHRLPEEYISAFKECNCVFKRPIMKSNTLIAGIIRRGFIPKFIFPIIAQFNLYLTKNKSIPNKGYLDYFFMLRKGDKDVRD